MSVADQLLCRRQQAAIAYSACFSSTSLIKGTGATIVNQGDTLTVGSLKIAAKFRRSSACKRSRNLVREQLLTLDPAERVSVHAPPDLWRAGQRQDVVEPPGRIGIPPASIVRAPPLSGKARPAVVRWAATDTWIASQSAAPSSSRGSASARSTPLPATSHDGGIC